MAPAPDTPRGTQPPGPTPDSWADIPRPPPAPDSLAPGMPSRRFGAPEAGAIPRVETVRLTRPDLERRAALRRSHARLLVSSATFAVMFLMLLGRLSWVTVIAPRMPAPGERPTTAIYEPPSPGETEHEQAAVAPPRGPRAMITDRNNQILAISLPTAALYANPQELIDPAQAAQKLKSVLPRLDEEQLRARLAETNKQFVYLARQLSPREVVAVNALGIPGVYFEQSERRRYPMGRAAAQVLGGVDIDGNGIAGVERFFNQRLEEDTTPLRLSLDVRIQAVVRDELIKAQEMFRAIGGCGIVMDVRTGEILAMVSLPDYDANLYRRATDEERFNRAVTGNYEPGSTFKLQTAAMALDYGTAQLWHEFDASHPIRIGRFTISDFEGKKRWLYLPEVLAYSSNIGAAHIGQTVGAERQRAWMQNIGMLSRIPIELPEAALPIVQSAKAWKEIVTLTVSFGHGISVSPLHVVRGTAAIANNGVRVRPTVLAVEPGTEPADTKRVMQASTSDTMRKLMRLVVTDGFGKSAEVAGYYPGGKTGTAEKVGHGGYRKHTNVAAFTSVFPMNAPRYAVYMMLDEPKATAATYGYATAGWVAAPAAGRVIARIGPMLGMLPDTAHAAQINAELAIPLQPGRPPGAVRTPPVASAAQRQPASAQSTTAQAARPQGRAARPAQARPTVPAPRLAKPAPTAPASPGANPPVPAHAQPPAARPTPPERDLRHDVRLAPSATMVAAQYPGSSRAPEPNISR